MLNHQRGGKYLMRCVTLKWKKSKPKRIFFQFMEGSNDFNWSRNEVVGGAKWESGLLTSEGSGLHYVY